MTYILPLTEPAYTLLTLEVCAKGDGVFEFERIPEPPEGSKNWAVEFFSVTLETMDSLEHEWSLWTPSYNASSANANVPTLLQAAIPAGVCSVTQNVRSKGTGIFLYPRMVIKAACPTLASGIEWTASLWLKAYEPAQMVPCRWCNGTGVGLEPHTYQEIPGGCLRCAGARTVNAATPQSFS